MTFDSVADAKEKNAALYRRLRAALDDHGYLTVYLGGTKIHAAITTTKGHSGYVHPRALCTDKTPAWV